jgi:hypothetical protein
MTIRFVCPKGHALYAKDSQVGKLLACPKCGETAYVPALKVDDIEIVAPPEKKSAPRVPTGFSKIPRAAISGLVVASLLFGGYLLFGKSRNAFRDSLSGLSGNTPTSVFVPNVDPEPIKMKLRQIGIAFLNFEAQTRRFTPINPTNLSWRVHLLPYLEQGPLYEQFKLDEPWDSPHNLALVKFMPEVFHIPGKKLGEGLTRIRTPTGESFVFGNSIVPKFNVFEDGSANTLLTVVVGSDKAVVWTQPDEFPIVADTPIESLGRLPENFICGVAADAKPIFSMLDISPFDFYALLTPRGHEPVDSLALNSRFEATYQGKNVGGADGSDVGNAMSQYAATSPSLAIVKQRKTKLFEVGRAVSNYESAFKVYPIGKNPVWFDANNKPKLSWRVHILQFMEYRPLFEQFKLNEPWDSPHNLQLIPKMPEIFRDPADPNGSTKTRVVRFTGPSTPFEETGPGPSSRDFIDGNMSTLILISCGADKAITWTKPEDIPFDERSAVACLGKSDSPVIIGLFANGGVATFDNRIPPDVFKAYVTHRGKEVIGQNPFLIDNY